MSESSRSRAIVVLGMHRSGTSAVTRLINLMGAELGSNLMAAMEGNNETGFWEHQDVVDVHEEVLTAIDRRWDDVRAFPGELATRADLAPTRERLGEIVRRDFSATPLWAVKDPRMCRLLPLWEPIFNAARVNPAFLLVLRNPMEIAHSLERRDGFALGKSLLLWLHHALEAERATRGRRRVFLRYETIVADWGAALTRIGAALDVTWPKRPADIAGEVAGFLRPQLRHFSIDDAAVLADERLSRWVREVHGALIDAVARDDETLHRRLDAVAAELTAAESLFDPVVDSRLSMIGELHRRIRRLEIDVAERDTRIAERDSRIAERDRLVAECDKRIAERDTRIGFILTSVYELRQDILRHAHVVIDREEQIKNLRMAVGDARAERDRIFRSSSWRLTRPLRAVGRFLHGLTGRVRHAMSLFRLRVMRPSMEPIKNIERTESGFRLVGTVGHFRLDLGRVLPACRAIVSYRIDGRSVLQPWLYQGGNPNFEEAHAARLPFRKGAIRTVVDMPAGVSALRIDAVDPDAAFTLSEVKIVEIGQTMLALFWLKTWAMTLLSDRASRVALVARLRDGLRRKGPQALMQRLIGVSTSPAYDEWIEAYDTLTAADRAGIVARIAAMKDPPLISVVMPCYNSPEKWLRRAIESVIEQIYPHWELCVADDASSAPHMRSVLEEYARRDSRIKIMFRPENGHIARATNSALAMATGRYVALLDHDDEYRPHALYMVAEELAAHPDAEVIYSDEDKLDPQGRRFDPYFKTDFSPDLMLSHNYLAHLIVYSRALIEKVGGFRVGFEGSQDYDLALRCLDASRPERVRHIPFILYHWRAIAGSVALSGDQKSYAHDAARRAIGEHLARIGASGAQVVGEESGTMHRVTYPLPASPPKVSIIVPTRDRVDLLAVCVTGLFEKTDYPNWELLVIDNGSIEPETHAFFERLKGDPRIRIVPYVRPFNYSAINNLGARQATGELLCLLNNDIEPINRDWLGEMVSHALRPGVGAVGAKLYYAHDAIQHAGVVTGIGGVAGHFEKHLPRKEFGYFRRPGLIQNFSAVTGACLVVRRAVFEDVGGLDEKDLTVAFNDVDFCLRLAARGYLNVWTPHAELYHYESASRGYEDSPEKIARFAAEETHMKRRWGKALLADPYYNPNLSLLHEQVRLAFPPRVVKPWKQAAAG